MTKWRRWKQSTTFLEHERTKNTYYQDCAISKTEAVNILHDDTIEKKPLDLLNYPNAITLSLTLTENDNGKT